LTTISATASSLGETLAQLISGGSNSPLAAAAAGTNSTSSSTTPSTTGSGPATVVSLSDQAQAAANQMAQSDQAAADSLQAYVEAHRVTPGSANSAQSLFDQTTALTNPPPTSSGSKVEAIVAQIKADASANEPPPFQSFTPTKSLSSSLTVDGYTLTLDTDAGTQFYGVELTGNGADLVDKHFGPSDGFIGGTQSPPDAVVSLGIPNNNNEAIDAVTITQNVATATASTVSSSAGSAATSSVNAQSLSITFLVNYATGAISAEQNAVSVSAQAAKVSPPGSALSTLA
jgi:hypothetical protein